MWGTCRCKQNRFLNMHNRLKKSLHDFVYWFARRSWILSLWKLEKYICIVLNLLTGITEAQTCGCRGSYLLSVFLFLYFCCYGYVFFQGKKVDSDTMIRMERATPLFSEDVVLDQRTGMIGTATAADDEEVLVILHSIWKWKVQ